MNKVTAIPPGSETLSTTKTIAEFATRPVNPNAAAAAMHILRLSLLDWICVASAGRDEPVSAIVRQMVCNDGGTEDAHVIGCDVRLPARAAALSNGTTSHALDYDDTHFIYLGHPSVAVFPAALAMAEKLGSTGPAFLEAALVGLETACRIGDWLGRGHYQHGFHQTATSGSFGAAAAAARLLGLDEMHTRHALGIAATKASGLKSQFGTMGKPYHAGLAASNGLDAALLAGAGFVSRPDGLECEQGFAATHEGAFNDGALVLADLGRSFVFEGVQHKFHACCHGIHATLEALIEARERHGVAPDKVEALEIKVHPRFLRVCNIEAPATGLEAKFSLRLAAAMALYGHDTSALSSFNDAVCRDARLVALRDRVQVVTDPDIPESAAEVQIEDAAGGVLDVRHDISDPVPVEMREARVRAKAASLLGAERAEACWQEIQGLSNPATRVSLQQLLQE